MLSLFLSETLSLSWQRGKLKQEIYVCPRQQVKLEEYGRPKIDGELKVCSIVNRTKQDR